MLVVVCAFAMLDLGGAGMVDLPAAGCWRLTMRWSARSDGLDLRYATPR